MHILVIPSFLPPYGGSFAIEQAKALHAIGNHVGIIHCQQHGLTVYPRLWLSSCSTPRHEEAAEGIMMLSCGMRGMPRMTHLNQTRHCRHISRLYDEYVAEYGHPDIIHAHCSQWAGVAAMAISRRHGVPYIITEHIPGMMFRSEYGEGWTRHQWARQLTQEAMERAEAVITVSDIVVGDLREFFGTQFKLHVVSNIIDTTFFACRGREPRAGRPMRYCCLGIANKREYIRKGYDILLEAFGMMTDDSELHIAGRGTDGKTFLRIIKDHVPPQRRRQVIVHGDLDRDHVRSLLYHSDALVLASRAEVQPLVILEALSTGIPVVSTDAVPYYPEYAGSVLIAKAGDADTLRLRMEEVAHIMPSPRNHDIVESMASPETVAREIQRIIETGKSKTQ